MKREGALVQNGRTQGRPKHTHESEAFQKKPFIEITVFQSVGKEGRESNGEGRRRRKARGRQFRPEDEISLAGQTDPGSFIKMAQSLGGWEPADSLGT